MTTHDKHKIMAAAKEAGFTVRSVDTFAVSRTEEIERFYAIAFEAGVSSQNAEIAELVVALSNLVQFSPANVECDNMHHAKFDQHEHDKTCPVVVKYSAARDAAQELLAKVRKP